MMMVLNIVRNEREQAATFISVFKGKLRVALLSLLIQKKRYKEIVLAFPAVNCCCFILTSVCSRKRVSLLSRLICKKFGVEWKEIQCN